jgi:hypothetical protein
LKNLRYSLFFLVLGSLSHALALNGVNYGSFFQTKSGIFETKKDQVIKLKKLPVELVASTGNLKKKFRPKKPKGIKVIDPHVPLLVFREFCQYCDFTPPEISGAVTFFLSYVQGKRGPPIA